MEKELIRKEFLKLRIKQKSYSKCKALLKKEYQYDVSIRTLMRWQHLFEVDSQWDLRDKCKKPHTIHRRVTSEATKRILTLRKQTGWGAQRLKEELSALRLSHTTINRVLRENNLTRKEGNRSKLPKGVRFQRAHVNSLWHIDDSEFGEKGKIIAVLDDCSRYCLGILHVDKVTTKIATQFLDELIKKYGNPRQIISDNGAPYGLRSKTSKFDKWCQKRKIGHIRTRVKRPQTNGKVERLFGTIANEITFCNNDLELFRYRYNHSRPHYSLKWKTPAYIFHDFPRNLI